MHKRSHQPKRTFGFIVATSALMLATSMPAHTPNYGLSDAAVYVGVVKPKAEPRTPSDVRAAARKTARSRGYSKAEWNCLDEIIQRESHWRIDAVNGSHYGIGQIRNLKHGTKATKQIRRVLDYITHRYGTACVALAHHNKRNWY